MNYCFIKDIETQISTTTLIQLTSDNGLGEIDNVVAQEDSKAILVIRLFEFLLWGFFTHNNSF